MEEVLKQICQQIQNTPEEFRPYEDLYYMCKETMKTDIPLGVRYLKRLSDNLEEIIPIQPDEKKMRSFFGLHRRVLLAAAPHDFESYILYIEWNRDPEKKFYPPRRAALRPVVVALR